MNAEDIIKLGGFKPDDTNEEALAKMIDLVIRVEVAKDGKEDSNGPDK